MGLSASRRTTYLFASVAIVGASLPFATRSIHWTSEPDVVEPTRATDGVPARHPEAKRTPASGELTPAAAKLLFALAHRTADDTNAGDLFASKSWYVPPPPPPPAPVAAPAPPSAPPLPYTFVGSYTEGNQATVYFLTAGDRVYDVKAGDTLDRIYSVDSVENGVMTLTYKPLNIRQTLAVGATP